MSLKPALKGAYLAATDGRYRYYYRQRRVENLAERDERALRIASGLPPSSTFATAGSDTLARDGIFHLKEVLAPRQLSEMRDYFASQRCADPYRPELGEFIAPANAPPQTHVAYFSNEVVAAAPHALQAANRPDILATVGAFLGAKPTISYMMAWWSMPAQRAAEHAELYHRDYDDYRFVKLFLYLTDVDGDSGPHCFVRGSHREEALLARIRHTDESVERAFAPDRLLRLEGKAGTAFLENTFGLHKGLPPRVRPRLIFQVLYSLHPYIAGPRSPVRSIDAGEAAGLDPYINRAYYRMI